MLFRSARFRRNWWWVIIAEWGTSFMLPETVSLLCLSLTPWNIHVELEVQLHVSVNVGARSRWVVTFAFCLICSGVTSLHWKRSCVGSRSDGRSSKENIYFVLTRKVNVGNTSLNFGLQRRQCLSHPTRRVSLSQGHCTVEILSSWNACRFAWRRNVVMWQSSGYSRFFRDK